MALSTMTCEIFCKPFSVPNGTVTRSKGAATNVLVTGNTVTLAFSQN